MICFNFSQPAQVHRVNLDDVITTHLITCVYVKLDIMAKTVIKVRKQLLWILDDESTNKSTRDINTSNSRTAMFRDR
jgi:hypothetical protein